MSCSTLPTYFLIVAVDVVINARLIKLLTLKYKKESMAQSEDIRIIWKTNCKWRDADYYVYYIHDKITAI